MLWMRFLFQDIETYQSSPCYVFLWKLYILNPLHALILLPCMITGLSEPWICHDLCHDAATKPPLDLFQCPISWFRNRHIYILHANFLPSIRWLIAMYRHACCCQPGVSFWNISNNKTHVMCHDLRLGLPSFYTGLLRWFTLTSTCHFPRFTCHIYLFNLTNACCLCHYFRLPALSIIYADFCIPTETCHVDFLSLPTF